jgi:hypothetical protein
MKQFSGMAATMRVNLDEQEKKLKYLRATLVLAQKGGEDTAQLLKLVSTAESMVATLKKTLDTQLPGK